MAKQTEGMAVASYTDDLVEYREGDVEDIPPFIRDLPAKYGIKPEEMKMPYTPRALAELIDSANPRERAEAEKIGQRCYYIIMNLMRTESGLDFTRDPLQEWNYDDLIGKKRRGFVNVGNARMRSMQVPQIGSTDQTYANDAEPGTFFRMVAHKGNFFIILASLRYFSGDKLSPEKLARMKNSKNHLRGRELLAFVDDIKGAETPTK